ncbi:MAG: hypothetical protein IPN27_11435 [Cellvibrionales bacterium]|nr:hypothetical protein [Cellvibrionales bacterium]
MENTAGQLGTAPQLQLVFSALAATNRNVLLTPHQRAQLDMHDLRLPFRQINSQLSYDSDNGLQAPSIKKHLHLTSLLPQIQLAKISTGHRRSSDRQQQRANISDIATWSAITPLKC